MYDYAQCRSGPLKEAREVVIEDLGDIPLVSLDFYCDSVLPQVSNTKLQEIRSELYQKKFITKNGGWKAFPKTANSGKDEIAFKGLQIIFGHVIEAASEIMPMPPVLVFEYNPNPTPIGERNNTSRPDGQLQLKEVQSLALGPTRSGVASSVRNEASEVVGACGRDTLRAHGKLPQDSSTVSRWEELVLPCEFKLKENGGEDNISKLIWSAHHILRTDPCRRFTFGITAENDQLRLWFFTRSHVMVTEPYSVVDDVDRTIRVFTSLAFADLPSLGFDPTVTRIMVNDEIQYRYEIGEHSYITTETLFDFSADFLLGRGTRVFRAYLESNPDVVVALKDVWLEDDRTPEGYLLEEMREAISKKQAQGVDFPGEKDPSEYFLTFHAHGRIKVGDKGDDHTTNVMMRGSPLPFDLRYFPTSSLKETKEYSSHVAGSDLGDSFGHTPVVTREVAALIAKNLLPVYPRFHSRIHYRIAFNEVGQTIHDLRDLSQVYQCLADATTALRIMHIIDYVHRDVSAGNVLFYEGRGILGDLEFAKRTSDLTVDEARTGTNQFESVEVAQRGYLFDVGETLPPFKFNCIHDLESTWWIALWVLCHHVPLDDNENRNEQVAHAAKLFPPVGISYLRSTTFIQGQMKQTFSLLAPTFQQHANYIRNAQGLLTNRYKDAERGSSVDENAFNNLHLQLLQIWNDARDHSSDIKYKLRPAKRGATEVPDEPCGPPKRHKS